MLIIFIDKMLLTYWRELQLLLKAKIIRKKYQLKND